MSGLGQNIHLLRCAAAVQAEVGALADWVTMRHLLGCCLQRGGGQTVETQKGGEAW